jgi:signal transduction histidine kinase
MAENPLERIIGRNVSLFIHEDDLPIIAKILKQGSDGVYDSERTVRLKGKSHIEVLLSARKLPVSNDNAHMCLVVTDMTERRRAEHAKDEFISLASHQLRTPATGVKQYIGMLLEGYAGEMTIEQKAFAQTAFDSNERQLAIINSILKTAQIDFGAYRLKIAKQDMKVLIEDTLAAFKPMLGMRRQIVDCQFEENACAMVEPVEISLVISNLIENASKYSPEGGQISIKLHKDDEQIVVAITDDGVGIEEEDHAKIFEKFTRVDNVLSDTVTGSGLGLYWVKKIVELHEGEIHLASMINIGSTFTIRLRSC